MFKRTIKNPIAQAFLLGVGLFLVSALLRVLANMLVGPSAGPGLPSDLVRKDGFAGLVLNTLLVGVALPALIETPFVVYLVRRTDLERASVWLWIGIAIISGMAWLLHGASLGALGQAVAFALLAYASWGWSRRFGRSAYWLAILAHAVWNGVGAAIYIARHFSMSHA